ncbi:MAG: hypothetical protein HQ461_08890 [Deltaproteobacteria bacterium]|nr:hypothetical protein [Deltaproteobacteria bacterium]
MIGRSPIGQGGVDPDAETPVPTEAPGQPVSVASYVLSGSYPSISEASAPVVAEFSVNQIVPRVEPTTRAFTSTEIFIRLEQTIYGPLSRERLAELLASGRLTGFEQASSNLRTWTPLIYHPRMVLAEDVDPETTHRMLQTESDLPKESGVQRRIDLAQYGEQSAAATEEAPAMAAHAMPLAKMLVRPRKRSSATHDAEPMPPLDLPVFGDLGQESLESLAQRAGAPGGGTMMMPAFVALAEGAVVAAPVLVSMLEDPQAMRENERPTLRMPATNGTGSVALAEPAEEPSEPEAEQGAAPEAAGLPVAARGTALFGLALAIAAVATVAAVYLFLRVATLERQVRLLEQHEGAHPK